jgi:hypothetical protein
MARLIILRLLDSYFRHRWLNLLPIVLMIGLASASFTLAEPEFVSRGRLYVQKAARYCLRLRSSPARGIPGAPPRISP